jgi:hypothetical protein
MYDCYSGSTLLPYKRSSSSGSITAKWDRYRDGGATEADGTPMCLDFVTVSSGGGMGRYPTSILHGREAYKYNEIIGVSVTATIELSTSLSLTNADVWAEFYYPTSDGKGTYICTGPASVLSTPTALDSSSATWTNVGGNSAKKISATFTPVREGPIIAILYVTKASITTGQLLYDPKMSVVSA